MPVRTRIYTLKMAIVHYSHLIKTKKSPGLNVLGRDANSFSIPCWEGEAKTSMTEQTRYGSTSKMCMSLCGPFSCTLTKIIPNLNICHLSGIQLDNLKKIISLPGRRWPFFPEHPGKSSCLVVGKAYKGDNRVRSCEHCLKRTAYDCSALKKLWLGFLESPRGFRVQCLSKIDP